MPSMRSVTSRKIYWPGVKIIQSSSPAQPSQQQCSIPALWAPQSRCQGVMVMRLLPALQLWIFLTCRIINYFVESLEMINHKQWYFKCFEWFFVTWPEPNTLSILVSCLTSCYCLMSGSCQHWLPDESKQMADAIHLRIGFQMSCKLEHGLESWSPSNFQFSNIYNIRPAVSSHKMSL